MKKMNNKGFSLVELIIVIAIMAILAGALAPALIKYVASSKRSTDVSNAGLIQEAMQTALSSEDSDSDIASVYVNYSATSDIPTENPGSGFWSVVDGDLSGGLAAFSSLKTTKLKQALTSEGSTTVSNGTFAATIDSSNDKVTIYAHFGSNYIELVPNCEAAMKK